MLERLSMTSDQQRTVKRGALTSASAQDILLFFIRQVAVINNLRYILQHEIVSILSCGFDFLRV
jgi:hypothetical protein